MELEVLKNEEKRMNIIMFLFLLVIPVVAFVYVLLFNGGGMKDAIALIMVVSSIITKTSIWRCNNCAWHASLFWGNGRGVLFGIIFSSRLL